LTKYIYCVGLSAYILMITVRRRRADTRH